jgi:hypothetical protein
MPARADRRRTERMMSNTQMDQLDVLETIRRAREIRAETRRLIEQARQARDGAAIIAGVPIRSGVSYQAWDWKVRQEGGKTKPA